MILGLKLGVVSTSCGLIHAPIEPAVEAFCRWQSPILAKIGCSLVRQSITGEPEENLGRLFPLTSPIPTKYLFLSVRNGWTVFFDNRRLGTDAAGSMAVIARTAHVPTLRVVAVSNTTRKPMEPNEAASFGATILELNGSDGTKKRTIFAANDGGVWRFGQSGDPMEFEEIAAYTKRPVRDRFTPEMLARYLRALGVPILDPAWCVAEIRKAGVLLNRQGPLPASYKEEGRSDGDDG